jgi:hypothetical protein
MAIPTEHDEQVMVMKWFNLAYAKFKGCLFAIPNGSHLAGTPLQRAKKVQRMKSEGFLPGVSDLFLMVPRGSHNGLWIEMKRRKFVPSDVSKEQREFQERAKGNGYRAEVCGGFEAAQAVIDDYLKG